MTFGTTPVSTTSLGANQFPVSGVAEPGLAGGNLTALEGGPGSVDANSNRTAPASIYVKDGGNVTQGATTDAAVTGDNAGTISAKMRGLTKILADIWDSVNHRIKVDGSGVTQPVSGTVKIAGTDGTTFDDIGEGNTFADAKQGMLVYGRTAGSGASAIAHSLRTDANGNLLILPSSATAALSSVGASTGAGGVQLLASNANRKGMYVFNESTAVLYLAFAGSASASAYTVQVAANGFFEMPTSPIYTGAIFGIWSAANGNARVTEMS